MNIGTERFLKGLCAKCGEKRESGNDTVWCHTCAEKERQNHTEKLSK